MTAATVALGFHRVFMRDYVGKELDFAYFIICISVRLYPRKPLEIQLKCGLKIFRQTYVLTDQSQV
jgi:hypothetical protein